MHGTSRVLHVKPQSHHIYSTAVRSLCYEQENKTEGNRDLPIIKGSEANRVSEWPIVQTFC